MSKNIDGPTKDFLYMVVYSLSLDRMRAAVCVSNQNKTIKLNYIGVYFYHTPIYAYYSYNAFQ